MAYHIIFEGAELTGKSWVMSRIYNELEPEYATSPNILDGCYWFNCDLGFFGTDDAPPVMKNYLEIFKTLKDKNILVEKFHLSGSVYSELNGSSKINFKAIEKKLKKMNFKIIMLTFPENEALIAQRLQDRLNLYPSYKRIAKTPASYLQQQKLYKSIIEKSSLEHLIVEVNSFPDLSAVAAIKEWIKK
jgi:hypothetical protein